MAFPRLQELAAAQNSNSLTDAMSVYIERKINEDLHFAAGLSHLWEVLYSRVNEHRLLIAELNVFGGPLALQCAEFFKQLSQTEVLKMLEIRKSIAEVHMQVHKKIDFLTVMRSFTLGSTKEADNVKILRSCNDCSLDNSPYYSSARLRIAFDPTKSSHYKLVDAGRIFYDIDIQIYSSETDKGSLCSDRFNYFNFNHFDSAIYWNDRLHWLETKNRQLMHYSLNIEDLDHPIMTTIPIPQRVMTFLKSYGYMDPMKILIQMSHLLHLEGKLFEWRGSLFLVCLDDFGSREFTINEMTMGYVRYIVPAGYIISPGLKDLSRAETYKWYQSLERVSVEE
ncbi:hypothetical protein Tco_0642454 [Tanacetum coccineum]